MTGSGFLWSLQERSCVLGNSLASLSGDSQLSFSLCVNPFGNPVWNLSATLEQGAMDEWLKWKNQSGEKEPAETDTQGEGHIENELRLSSKLNTTYKASSVRSASLPGQGSPRLWKWIDCVLLGWKDMQVRTEIWKVRAALTLILQG